MLKVCSPYLCLHYGLLDAAAVGQRRKADDRQ